MHCLRSLLLAFTICFGCYGQQLVKSFSIELKGSNKQNYFSYNKRTGNLLMLFFDRNKLEISELDSSFMIVNQLKRELDFSFESDLVGTFSLENTYYLYFKANESSTFTQFKYDANTNKFRMTPNVTTLLDDEVSLGYFLSGNDLVHIGIGRRTSHFIVATISPGLKLTRKVFDLSQSDFLNKYKDLYRFFKKNDASVYNNEFTLPALSDSARGSFSSAHFKAKMYQRGQECIFTFDSDEEKTKVLIVNIENGKADYKELSQINDIVICDGKGNVAPGAMNRGVSGTTMSKASASVVTGNILYRAYVCSEGVNLQSFDLQTGDLVKGYTSLKDEKIIFANTPVMKKGFSDKSGDKEGGSTAKFLGKLSFNEAVLTAYNYGNGTVELKLGSYFEQKSGGGGMMMMPAGGMVGGGVTMMMVPMFYGNLGRNWKDDKKFKSFYVKCIFDTNATHIDGPMVRKDVNAEIDKFIEASELNTDAEDIVKVSENIYLFGFYLKKEKKYYIYRFDE